MQYQMVTASTLREGAVVYMGKEQNWSSDVNDGWVVPIEEAETLLEAASAGVADQVIVGPYLIDVTIDDGQIIPIRYREQIRATGPTTMEA